MIQDYENLFSRNQTLAIAASTFGASNSLDLWGGRTAMPSVPGLGGTPLSDIGRGRKLMFFAQVTADFTSGGAATLKVELIMGTGVDGNGVINAGQVVLWDSGAIAKATCVAGYLFRCVDIPPGVNLRYLSSRYTIGTAAGTGGTITAGLTDQVPSNYGYWV